MPPSPHLRQLPVDSPNSIGIPESNFHRLPLNNYPDEGWRGISPFVTTSVLWSLYSFLRTPEDYWETVCTAIAVGGDVDTTAAMAGAISGAYLGLDAIPLHLARCVTDRGTWGFSELVGLAHLCHRLKTQR